LERLENAFELAGESFGSLEPRLAGRGVIDLGRHGIQTLEEQIEWFHIADFTPGNQAESPSAAAHHDSSTVTFGCVRGFTGMNRISRMRGIDDKVGRASSRAVAA
jgi:hypothetical protein